MLYSVEDERIHQVRVGAIKDLALSQVYMTLLAINLGHSTIKRLICRNLFVAVSRSKAMIFDLRIDSDCS